MNNYIIFSAQYPPHVGGVDRYSEAIAFTLADLGNRVYVVTSQYGDLLQEERLSENLMVMRVPSHMLLDGRMPVLLPSARWRAVKRFLRQIDNPRVIIQTFLYPFSYISRRFISSMGWSCIVINHGCNYVCQGHGIVDKAEHIYEEIMARIITRKTMGCFSVSQEAEKWAKHFSIHTAGILHNGVDAPLIEEKLKTLSAGIRERYSIPSDTFVVAFVGRMIKEKGIIQLIQAVQELQKEGCNVALVAAGGGEELEKVRANGADGKIVFTDNVSHDDVLRILRECDCCCLPSDSEGLPTVLLEAALADCFLITSPYGGSPEIVDGVGIVMRDNTKDSIRQAITKAMEYEGRREIMKRAKDRVKHNFVWSKTCQSLEKLDWNGNKRLG